MKFDFSKIPSERHAEIAEAINRSDLHTLKTIHDQYKVSGYDYCCDLSGLLAHFSASKQLFQNENPKEQ
jgi:hypothetical protein